jgi:hypothetical protein
VDNDAKPEIDLSPAGLAEIAWAAFQMRAETVNSQIRYQLIRQGCPSTQTIQAQYGQRSPDLHLTPTEYRVALENRGQ